MNKGIIITIIIAIFVISSVLILISDFADNENIEAKVLTGTPADNYSQNDREKFCGTGDAKSTKFITEYKIPTDCTQPQAITIGTQGNVWFAQSNTGKLAKFNPLTESFTEYENRFWTRNDNSMIWGIDYATDGTLWFTDDKNDSVWKFEIETQEYTRITLPSLGDSLPQRLTVDGSKVIINDFTENKIIFLNNIQSEDEFTIYTLPSNAEDAVVAAFTIDSDNNLWYSNWILGQVGVLTKINLTSFDLSIQNDEDVLAIEFFSLPSDLKTTNGIAEDNFGNIWLADSSSSLIFKLEPLSETFTKYTTSQSSQLAYGNYTGKIKSLASQPYWIEKTSSGKLVFNEQGANRIGVLDPTNESLVEYTIPSKNPHWGDCENQKDCGLAKVFDIAINDEKIWFSEWAENNIGFVDTKIPLSIDVVLPSEEISLTPGESINFSFETSSDSQNTMEVTLLVTNPNSEDNLSVKSDYSEKNFSLNSDSPLIADVEISASDTAAPGEYKILLGAKTNEVSFSKYMTILVG